MLADTTHILSVCVVTMCTCKETLWNVVHKEFVYFSYKVEGLRCFD